ncbi:MAG: T9SS type A sorting domain-containing protein [Salibacteraceae bacterium]
MIRFIFIYLLYLLIGYGFTAKAQSVGAFDTLVVIDDAPFNGDTRTLSVFVPTDYNPNQTYGLIVALHGHSQNSAYLRNRLNSFGNSQDYIIVCPDGNGNQFDDEYNTNEIAIIETALDFAQDNYSTDSTTTYLFGFSLGGRTALYYGLANHDMFNGILAFAPAYQSEDDVNNLFHFPWNAPFEYQNGQYIPTCLCVGSADNYRDRTFLAYQKLQDQNAYTIFNEVSGLNHTIDYSSFSIEISNCMSFFNSSLSIVEATTINPTIYPNPVDNILNFTSSEHAEIILVQITDILGKPVYKNQTQTSTSLDVSVLNSGTYFLTTVLSDGNTCTQQFIKH